MLRVKAPLQKDVAVDRPLSPYDQLFLSMVQGKGGFYNAHAHLDRADTLDDDYLGHINTTPLEASFQPLSVKQNLVGDLHRGLAYSENDLRARMTRVVERLIVYGTTGLATCIDVSPDLPERGMLAFRIAREIKAEFADRIKIYLAPNPIFGFKEGTSRWEVFEEAAQRADFLSCLPEKDDYTDPAKRDGKIGYRAHLRKVMELACKLGKELHLHLDQANDPNEQGTKTLIEGLRWLDKPVIAGQTLPTVWAIHSISPAGYSEADFKEVIQGLLESGVGVIVCPTAAISMRQLRPIVAPLHNSIARVLELLKAKVPVLIGTDNIADVFVPQSDGDMLTEVKMLGHAIRFPTPHVLAVLAAGETLNEIGRSIIGAALYQERKVYEGMDPSWKSAIN
jgi:cytosine deaminase